MNAVECPPFYARTTGLEGKVDRWQDIEYVAPGFYQLSSRIAPVGRPPVPDGTDDHAYHMVILYGLTPATDGRVHDFWALSRDFCSRATARWTSFLMKMQTNVVQEDVDALNVLESRAERRGGGQRGQRQDRQGWTRPPGGSAHDGRTGRRTWAEVS